MTEIEDPVPKESAVEVPEVDLEEQKAKGGSKCANLRMRNFACFGNSPCYYYFRFFIVVLVVLMAPAYVKLGSPECKDNTNNAQTLAYFVVMTILWVTQGLVHLVFIVHRKWTDAPPLTKLYAGGIEKTLSLPLTILMFAIILCGIWGILIATGVVGELPCGGASGFIENKIIGTSLTYSVISGLVLLRLCRKDDQDEENNDSVMKE